MKIENMCEILRRHSETMTKRSKTLANATVCLLTIAEAIRSFRKKEHDLLRKYMHILCASQSQFYLYLEFVISEGTPTELCIIFVFLFLFLI